MSDLEKLINEIEKDLENSNIFQIGVLIVALSVIEDRLWNRNIDGRLAQKCTDLKFKIFGEEQE